MIEDAIERALDLLLAGAGFHFYRVENLIRADDLLVRQRAGVSLGQAAARLELVSQQFQRDCIPAASREQPFPPAEVMERLNALRRLRQHVMDQAALLNGLSAPAQDKIWKRLRDEERMLRLLLEADVALLQRAADVEQQTQALSAEGWKSAAAGAGLEAALQQWEAAVRTRQELLLVQAYR